tara:strand:- start:1722 stop:2132 length:411 start_codon:yes stop_codon:yes gene_type:complete
VKFKTLNGSTRSVFKIKRFIIDWDAESKSKIQFNAKQFLKKYWSYNVVFEEFPVAGTKLSLDFYNASKKIAVEVQGAQHRKHVPFFHGDNKVNYIDQLRRDKQKMEFCEINDIIMVEIYDTDILSKSLFKKQGVSL